jgi:transcriptional regulator with XRE-family HTH domain
MRKGKMVKATPMPGLNAEFSMEMLGHAIRSKRSEKGWRIDDLALKADLSRRTIMKIEKGDPKVSFANIMLLMDILGLSLRVVDLSQLNTVIEPNLQKVDNEDGWYE